MLVTYKLLALYVSCCIEFRLRLKPRHIEASRARNKFKALKCFFDKVSGDIHCVQSFLVPNAGILSRLDIKTSFYALLSAIKYA